jgi:MoxR-vWA-beta-propeller ternary system domain bpX2
MKEFVVILSETDRSALASIRTLPKVEAAACVVADETPQIFLRGILSADKLPIEIQKLPIQAVFILKENLLFPIGGVTPLSKLPDLKWQSLLDFTPIELPKSPFPAVVDAKTPVRLVDSEHIQKSCALLTDFKEWAGYVETAPQVRLNKLFFAVSKNGKVLILSDDVLPPISGSMYWQDAQMLLPCGKAFELSITAYLLTKKYDLERRALFLFSEELGMETPQRIELQDFVPCTRSAVRLTQEQNTLWKN